MIDLDAAEARIRTGQQAKADLLAIVEELRVARDAARALRDLVSWDHGGSVRLRARHRNDAGVCAHCGGEWPCPPYVALDALDAYGRRCWVGAQQVEVEPPLGLAGALLALTATFTDRMGDYVRSSWWRSDELAVIASLARAS